LFAALNIATGMVIGKLSTQHRAADFRDFPGQIDRQAYPALAVHVICDNLSAHKTPVIHRWLLAHPRFVLHFTPTYSSWINRRSPTERPRWCLGRWRSSPASPRSARSSLPASAPGSLYPTWS
jgi:DDE superfamily endonuclease